MPQNIIDGKLGLFRIQVNNLKETSKWGKIIVELSQIGFIEILLPH